MERETKSVQTPHGHEVVIKTYLTGREAEQVQQVLYADIKMSMGDLESGKTEIKEIPAAAIMAQQRKALELLLVSLDGSSENVMDRFLDLPSEDCDTVKSEVSTITNFRKEK